MGSVAANNKAVAREFKAKLTAAVKDFDKKDRKRILKQAALPVQKAAESKTTVGDKVHYYYRKNKTRAKIYPGNLRKSINRLTFRKSLDAFVGPRFGAAGKRNEVGRTKATADGYYARMVFGSSAAFNRNVLEPALTQSRDAFLRRAQEVREKILQRAKQKGLNVK